MLTAGFGLPFTFEVYMITFYGSGVVWDSERNKPLVRFVNGKYSTNDPAIAEKLFMKYKYSGEYSGFTEPKSTDNAQDEKSVEQDEPKKRGRPRS